MNRGATDAGPAEARWALPLVLALALAVRLWMLATHTYIVWPDETFQYLEPAHRLVFGAGVITWEYLDGVRSWLLPALVAPVMWLAAQLDPSPLTYVAAVRVGCALASLSVPFVGYRLVAARQGTIPAIITALLCALSTEAVYFAPVLMTEPLATDAALLAIWLGDPMGARQASGRRLFAAGLLFGLAFSLRYQYAPAIGLAILAQHGRDGRRFVRVVAGAALVAALSGGLDWATWGSPFQSVWLNFRLNALQGVSGAMGAQPWFYYAAYYPVAWGALAPLLLVLALFGALRLPALALAALATLALHSLTPHKELRFVFLATAAMPMLVGAGLGGALLRIRALRRPLLGLSAGVAAALAVAGLTALSTTTGATPPDAWHRDRSMLAATEAARRIPTACGLAVRSIWVYRSGGYTYWRRDLPIYFETWERAQHLEDSAFRLRLQSVVGGRPVEQFPGEALAGQARRFNTMIGRREDILPGFAEQACFGAGTPDDPTYCMATRPGGCD